MIDETDEHKSWLERLTHLLSREPQNRQQLIKLIKDAKARELIDNDALHMIEGVLEVTEMQVRDAMIPRAQMVTILEDATPSSAIPTIIKSRHSRFPVITNNRDKVLGILHAKDLLPYQLNEKNKKVTVREIARPATFIPESKRLNVLLNDFRLNRMHMAIVVDEYGNIAGLITIEDVLEEIVGEIEDEFDVSQDKIFIKQVDNNNYSVQALAPIEAFNEFFSTEIDDENFDTIGGFLLQKFSHFPKPGETIHVAGLIFTVIQSNNRGINLIRVTREDRDNKEG